MTSVGQRCRANGVYVRVVNVRRHVWQRKRWRPAGRPSFFTLAVRQRGQCGILIPSQRKQYQQRDANLAHCNFAVSGGVLQNLLSSSGQIAISLAGAVAALATILTLTFFLILGSERYVNAGVGLFPERHQPLVRRLLSQSAGAISGYITGNLAISVICGITTFIVLLILGMPYAAPLALLVAVLDLIPLVGATLGGALLVVVGLFVEPWKAVVLLVYIVVYQQAEGSVLQPIVYSKAVQLNGLVILIALLVGGQLLGIPGALLAIPVAEIIRIVVTELLAYRRTKQEANEANEPAVASSSPPTTSE